MTPKERIDAVINRQPVNRMSIDKSVYSSSPRRAGGYGDNVSDVIVTT
jgi:hypothetical protein